jgi:hypothetical protein
VRQVRDANVRRLQAQASKPKREAPKPLTAREKALQFAKQVPKPAPRKEAPTAPPIQSTAARKQSSGGGGGGGARASSKPTAAAAARPQGYGYVAEVEEPRQLTMLEQLELQHRLDCQRVAGIRAEMATVRT